MTTTNNTLLNLAKEAFKAGMFDKVIKYIELDFTILINGDFFEKIIADQENFHRILKKLSFFFKGNDILTTYACEYALQNNNPQKIKTICHYLMKPTIEYVEKLINCNLKSHIYMLIKYGKQDIFLDLNDEYLLKLFDNFISLEKFDKKTQEMFRSSSKIKNQLVKKLIFEQSVNSYEIAEFFRVGDKLTNEEIENYTTYIGKMDEEVDLSYSSEKKTIEILEKISRRGIEIKNIKSGTLTFFNKGLYKIAPYLYSEENLLTAVSFPQKSAVKFFNNLIDNKIEIPKQLYLWRMYTWPVFKMENSYTWIYSVDDNIITPEEKKRYVYYFSSIPYPLKRFILGSYAKSDEFRYENFDCAIIKGEYSFYDVRIFGDNKNDHVDPYMLRDYDEHFSSPAKLLNFRGQMLYYPDEWTIEINSGHIYDKKSTGYSLIQLLSSESVFIDFYISEYHKKMEKTNYQYTPIEKKFFFFWAKSLGFYSKYKYDKKYFEKKGIIFPETIEESLLRDN